MTTIRLRLEQASDFFEARYYLPSHFLAGTKDYFDLRPESPQVQDNRPHIRAAIDWLCRAQDATEDGGVSARYRLDRGWTPSYPETTGYIIPTFLNFASLTHIAEFRERAKRMSDWLLGIQQRDGGFPGHDVSKRSSPVVFNTGQIMYGLLCAYRQWQQPQYLNAAIRAGDWLLSIQEKNGSWKRFTYLSRVHTYHTRVAWPLLMLWQSTGKAQYRKAAIKTLEWALTKQQDNGWFAHSGFSDNANPYLHTIAYTMRGFLEAAALLAGLEAFEPIAQRCFDAVQKAAGQLLHRFEIRRYPYAQYDRHWKSHRRFSCLTGNSQMAYIWLRLFEKTSDARYLNAALKLNDFVKTTQDLSSANPGIRGGIKGSHPIWGKYIRHSYPNWSAKFYVDALMLEDTLINKLYQESGL